MIPACRSDQKLCRSEVNHHCAESNKVSHSYKHCDSSQVFQKIGLACADYPQVHLRYKRLGIGLKWRLHMQMPRITREFWNPHTDEERELVRKEMEALLSSPHFASSKRYPAFLRYIVEKELAGQGDSLKERTVGVEVFHRQPNYDTNIDTVVRFTAGEVRKRLEVFYHENEDDHPVQISLQTGSYIPRFLRVSWADVEPRIDKPAALPATPLQAVTKPTSTSAWHLSAQKYRWLALMVLIAVGGAWLGARFYSDRQEANIARFWGPFQKATAPPLICTGTVVFSPADMGSPIPATRNDNYPYLSLGTARAVSKMTELFGTLHLRYIVQPAPNVDLTELNAQPVVLIGAYTNSWTLQLTNGLRYHFAPGPKNEIEDANNPEVHWRGSHAVPYSNGDIDYSLVARYRDPVTNRMTVVIAGLGINGTAAASAFVTSPQLLDSLNHALPKNWDNRNFELVLESKVIDNEPGPPTIVAAYHW